jgi:hypothetical protein
VFGPVVLASPLFVASVAVAAPLSSEPPSQTVESQTVQSGEEPFQPPVESVNNHPFKQQKTLRAYIDALTAESEDAQARGDEAVLSQTDTQND